MLPALLNHVCVALQEADTDQWVARVGDHEAHPDHLIAIGESDGVLP